MQTKNPGFPRTMRLPQNIDMVKRSIVQPPQREYAAVVELSASSGKRILYEELQFRLYRQAMAQQLNPRDFVARSNCTRSAIWGAWQRTYFTSYYFGCVNMHYQSSVNSRLFTVWCALAGSRTGLVCQEASSL